MNLIKCDYCNFVEPIGQTRVINNYKVVFHFLPNDTENEPSTFHIEICQKCVKRLKNAINWGDFHKDVNDLIFFLNVIQFLAVDKSIEMYKFLKNKQKEFKAKPESEEK